MTGLSDHQRGVRDLARAWARGPTAAGPLPAGLDARRFLEDLATRPYLATLLPVIDADALPADAAPVHGQLAHQVARRSGSMLLELERLLPELSAVGRPPVVLKGAALAVTAYDRPEDRWFLDIDLLVEPADVEPVCERLAAVGFAPVTGVAPPELYDRHHFHRIVSNPRGLCLEVHWALTLPRSVYTFDLAALRRDARPVALGTTSMLVPSTRDQILHGVLQSVAGGFADLRRILDLHRLDTRLAGDERREVCRLARAHALATGLWLQYRLRDVLLEAPMPAVVREECRPEPGLERTLERLDLPARCLGRRWPRDGDLDTLVHWLCTPRALCLREIAHFVMPDRAGLMPMAWSWDRAPLWRRALLAVQRVPPTLRLLGWWLAARLGRRAG